jgi:hypothetical protein
MYHALVSGVAVVEEPRALQDAFNETFIGAALTFVAGRGSGSKRTRAL